MGLIVGAMQLSGVGVVFQVPDQAGAEVSDVALDLAEVIPHSVQAGDHDGWTDRRAASIVGGVAVQPVSPAREHPDAC